MTKVVSRLLLLVIFLCQENSSAAELPIKIGDNRTTVAVKSLLEIRDDSLVRQGWDISCGAAALSTVLTYYFDAPYTELTIAVSILANTDPQKVRDRGGFSLLDLKRFAEAVGYEARGFGGLSLDDLATSNVPVILPVRIHGFDHFVVYRGRFAGRILIGDPAFGNITFSEQRFARIWTSGVGFVVHRKSAEIWDGEALAAEQMDLVVPNLNYVHRLLQAPAANPYTRRPIVNRLQ